MLLQLNGDCWLYLLKAAKNGFLVNVIPHFFGPSCLDDGGDDDADNCPDNVGAWEGFVEAGDGGGVYDGHHDHDMDLDLLAESESESEGEGDGAEGGDGGSTAAAQSIQTGATAGSDALFSDDESAESSHPEDEERDAGESDEEWAEGFTFNEE